MVKNTLLLAFAVPLIFTGCNDGPSAEPSTRELIGEYALAPESRKNLTKAYGSVPESKIVLRSDSTVFLYEIPDSFVDSFGKARGHFLSGEGTWKIEPAEVISDYGIDVDITAGAFKAAYYHSRIVLKGQEAPFKIHLIVGDPDNSETIVYEKSEL